MTDPVAAFGYELGVLKRTRRPGWWHAGVRDPESVAGHTMRTSQLAALLAAEEGGSPPPNTRDTVRAAVLEYDSGTTVEARCARDADKLEMLLQAVEYRETGVRGGQGWIDSAPAGLTTETGRRVAEAAVRTSPLAWRDR